ncbi:hypothetical protein A2159_01310 [Candidatus Woesebacteria bacterium RBG_13_34_9]|uniref:Uncharacterized protein n=1 Tax=Candidatus Woesebacteria bacterium RBG_13_34_9 TaxID=1802477 RepID=A0A1F7X626_9BACT|nr:MAG: hypothetical protein A2159_01310 [Candidatus Woesebacteria bacterium RBG_13_34_9]
MEQNNNYAWIRLNGNDNELRVIFDDEDIDNMIKNKAFIPFDYFDQKENKLKHILYAPNSQPIRFIRYED